MSAQSRLNKGLAAISIACVAGSCLGREYIEELRSTETTHGLYEVREAARKFVAEENAREKLNLIALERKRPAATVLSYRQGSASLA